MLGRGARIAGTFTTIALLWSLWSSPTLGAWLDMLGRGLHGPWSFPNLLGVLRGGPHGS